MNRKSRSAPVFCAAALAAGCLAAGWTGASAQRARVPVMYGGAPGLDACGGLGRVRGLQRGGDNFLSVRAGPGTHHREIDRLRNGRSVWFCDGSGDWIGIVYGAAGQECNVGSPVARKMPYPGPCRSGWVHKTFVELMAG